MNRFSNLQSRFSDFGGWRLVLEYARMGLLWQVAGEFFLCLVKGRPFKEIYPRISRDVEDVLRKEFEPVMYEAMGKYSDQTLAHSHSPVVWFCWLQGEENYPPVVKACLNSIRKNLPDREIRQIDSRNYHNYINIPREIERKWEKGIIPTALFSDIIRLELLIKYGGTWIDSTVLITNGIPDKIINACLFMPQYTKPGSNVFGGISNWFITSCTDNEVLMVIRDMIFEYWRRYDCTVWYYIFHLFVMMTEEKWPEAFAEMPYLYSIDCLKVMHNWSKPFDAGKWGSYVQRIPIHKLSWRPQDKVVKDPDNYYNAIISIFDQSRTEDNEVCN